MTIRIFLAAMAGLLPALSHSSVALELDGAQYDGLTSMVYDASDLVFRIGSDGRYICSGAPDPLPGDGLRLDIDGASYALLGPIVIDLGSDLVRLVMETVDGQVDCVLDRIYRDRFLVGAPAWLTRAPARPLS